MRTSPKFRRAIPDERRAALIEATLRSLARHGHAGVSVRRIAAEAGVSPGLINHHFASVEELIAQAYETHARGILDQILARTTEAGDDPRAWLTAFFEASFSPLVIDPQLLNVWIVYWSLLPHAPELKAIQERTWADYRAELGRRLEAAARREGIERFDGARAALGLSAMLDGLWVEACLNPSSYPPEVGVSTCEDHVEATLLLAKARIRRSESAGAG